MKTSLLITIFCIATTLLFGQKKEFKFGKIEMTDLTNNVCPIDSSADAYVIGEYGTSSFNYLQDKGFETIFEHHIRIKIIRKTAFEWATFAIPVYNSSKSGDREKVSDLKANTYNLENDQIVISKMEKSAVFEEVVNQNWTNIKFTFPNVKEGSVLEFSYKIYSDFPSLLRDWTFQKTIPVLYSEYETRIPEYFSFKEFMNGYENIQRKESSNSSSIRITEKGQKEGIVTISQAYTETINFTNIITTYFADNIRAFKDEPYMKSRKNYVSSLELELRSVHYPNSPVKDYSSNWESISKDLMNSEYFGDITNREGATNDIVKAATNGIKEPLDKATAVFNYVRTNFKWNGSKRLYATKGIRKIIDDHSGNSAEINLLLIAALKNAGLNAEPVVLSTRDNGMILMELPVAQKLNFVVACCEINGKKYLLDATDKNNVFGILPDLCLNGQGRIIRESAGENIDLSSNDSYGKSVLAQIKINPNGELNGVWQENRKGYAAHSFRDEVSSAKSKDDYVQTLQKELTGFLINKYEFENLDTLTKDVKIQYDVSLTGYTETAGNLLMIHPLLSEQLLKNPFRMEDRKFPVDFSFNHNVNFIAQYDIPEGYQIETLPKPMSIILPDKSASFTYNIAANGNKLQVIRKFQINKVMFLPDEYATLKEFYNKMVAKESEFIVLKKI